MVFHKTSKSIRSLAVAEHVGDHRLDGRHRAPAPNGPGMAQGARTPAGEFDAGLLHVAAHDHGDRQAAERLEGGSGTQEDLPMA
jgi:hypothetical protein